MDEHTLPCATVPAVLDTAAALVILGDAPFGVIIDDTGPVALVQKGDLTIGQLPPAVVVPAGLSLAQLANSSVLTLVDACPAVHGFVVVDNTGTIKGVMPIDVLDEYLGSGRFLPPSDIMGPAGHPGDVQVPGDPGLPMARVRCRFASCGFVNTLAYYDQSNPPQCANPDLTPHVLVMPRSDPTDAQLPD